MSKNKDLLHGVNDPLELTRYVCTSKFLSSYFQRKKDSLGLASGKTLESYREAWLSRPMGDGETLAHSQRQLDVFIDEFFTLSEAKKIRDAIRKRVARQRGLAGVSVTLSNEAHQILSDFADADGVTLSQVVERRLGRQYRRRFSKDEG